MQKVDIKAIVKNLNKIKQTSYNNNCKGQVKIKYMGI